MSEYNNNKKINRVKITGLWKKKSKDGSYSWYNGFDNNKNWQVHPNPNFEPGSKQPEFILFLASFEDDK